MPAETHVEKGPFDRRQVFEIIRDQLADILEIDPAAISEGASPIFVINRPATDGPTSERNAQTARA